MKILVTGANGYLGSGIVGELIKLGYDVIATDINADNINKKATIKECNLFDILDPFAFFNKPDILLHLAWRNGFEHNAQSHIIDLPKHVEFVNKMAKSGIKRISVMGTMHEIGFFEGSIDENTPTNPKSFYGISKNALRQSTELICNDNNIEYQWLRGFYIVGNNSIGSSIFSKIYRAEKENKETFPFTSGRNQWDFIDYDFFCKMVATTIVQNEVFGIINICSGYPQKLSERVQKYIKDNKFNIKLDYGKFPDRPYDSKAVWGNSDKINYIMEKYGNKD